MYDYNTRDFAGQGVVRISDVDTATDLPINGFEDVGNCIALSIGNTVEWREKREMRTGKQNRVKRLPRTTTYMVKMTLESTAAAVLKRLYFGAITALAAATITAEPAVAYVGRSFKLSRMNLTAFTSLTNAGATVTYVNGTDYKVNLKSGVVEIPAASAIANATAVRANYVAGTSEKLAVGTESYKASYVLFEGLNTAEDDNPVNVEIFRVRFSPPSEWQMIQEDGYAAFEIEGEAEYSNAFASDGGIFRETQLQAA